MKLYGSSPSGASCSLTFVLLQAPWDCVLLLSEPLSVQLQAHFGAPGSHSLCETVSDISLCISLGLLAGGDSRFYKLSVTLRVSPIGSDWDPSAGAAHFFFSGQSSPPLEGIEQGLLAEVECSYFTHFSLFCFSFTEFLDPFQRVIQPEEIWLYKNPLVQSDNIPTRLMFVSTVISWLIWPFSQVWAKGACSLAFPAPTEDSGQVRIKRRITTYQIKIQFQIVQYCLVIWEVTIA